MVSLCWKCGIFGTVFFFDIVHVSFLGCTILVGRSLTWCVCATSMFPMCLCVVVLESQRADMVGNCITHKLPVLKTQIYFGNILKDALSTHLN